MNRPPEVRAFLGEASLNTGEIIVDSFAGGGGASLGISWALGRSPDIAINHDEEAIALHKANHPETTHYPEDVWTVDPKDACGGRPVGLMWLSPDCKHFSKAKGGKPVEKKIRGLAWTAVRWAKAVKPRVMVLENVEEFQDWGPLFPANHRVKKLRNRPNPKKRGLTFRAFVGRLRRLGYEVQWRQLRGCHFGAPTIRKRLFLIARCDGQAIVWPDPTHAYGAVKALQPARVAAECIDWSLTCPSIFSRKKALAENTLKRIARGIDKFVVNNPRPFIVGLGGRMSQTQERHVGQPFQTICSKADSAVVAPRLVPHLIAMQHQNPPTSIEDPLGTVTTQGNKFNVVTPFLVPTAHQGDERAQSIEEPVRTICGGKRGDHAVVTPNLVRIDDDGKMHIVRPFEDVVVAPFLKPRYGEDMDPSRRGGLGQAPRVRSLEEPMPVIVPTGNGGDLVSTFLARHYSDQGQRPGSKLDEPISTVTPHDHHSLVAVHMAQHNTGEVGHTVERPLSTIVGKGCTQSLVTSHLSNQYSSNTRGGQGDLFEPFNAVLAEGQHIAEVRAFLVTYYSTGNQRGDLREPMHTITSEERFGLVTVDGVDYQIADIGMRMLAPRELYRAQGFPDSYEIEIPFDYKVERKAKGKTVTKIVTKTLTKTAQVRMCGNSVNPQVAAAIIAANLAVPATQERIA